MAQTIITKFLAPTNSRGARIVAKCWNGKVTISYPVAEIKDAQLLGKHISAIKPGDTVLHNGQVCTVTASNLSRGDFMGALLFGDSYSLGNKPVIVITNVRF